MAKKKYNEVVSELIQNEKKEEYLQQKLEILKLFLELADFGKLRAEYERHLLEGKKVKFKVYRFNKKLEYATEVG